MSGIQNTASNKTIPNPYKLWIIIQFLVLKHTDPDCDLIAVDICYFPTSWSLLEILRLRSLVVILKLFL